MKLDFSQRLKLGRGRSHMSQIGRKGGTFVNGSNIGKLDINQILSNFNSDDINFEGMPRMIFDNETRNQKVNWMKLVNNVISFNKQ